MAELHARSSIPVSRDALYRWHASPGAFDRLVPPWEPVSLHRFDGIDDGDLAVIRIKQGPVSLYWHARHSEHVRGHGFVDTQESGPFRVWRHAHRFLDGDDPLGSVLQDDIVFRPTGTPLDRLAVPIMAERMRRQFVFRHRTTAGDLRIHGGLPARNPLTVSVTGANGLVGAALCAFLETGGHRVLRVVRRPDALRGDGIVWDPEQAEPPEAMISGVDAVIHLAGAPLDGGAWTPAYKRRIIDSRVGTTEKLALALERSKNPPPRFLIAGGTAAYGVSRSGALDEESSTDPESGFLPALTKAWEDVAEPARRAGIATTILRMGPVLDPRAGLLKALRRTIALRVVPVPGSGTQQVSWIALDDVLGAILTILRRADLTGPVNLTAPNPVSMRELGHAVGHAALRVPVPDRAVRLIAGEKADETALADLRVLPARLLDAGFEFRHPTVLGAVQHATGAFGKDDHPDVEWQVHG